LGVADHPARSNAVAVEQAQDVVFLLARREWHDEREGVELVSSEGKLPALGKLAVSVNPAPHERELSQVRFDGPVGALMDQAKVEQAVLEVAGQLAARRMGFEREFDLRVAGKQPVEPRTNEVVEQALAHQYPIADRLLGFVAAAAPVCCKRLTGRKECAHVVEKGRPFRGQRRPLPRTPHEQRKPELLFERLDLIADRSLGNTEIFGAAPKAASGAETGENLQLAKGERKAGHYRFVGQS